MISTKINNFDILSNFNRVHVKITEEFFNRIKREIKTRYKSLKRYNETKLKINPSTFQSEFKANRYHPFTRIIRTTKDINLHKEEVYPNIVGFYSWGSHRKNLIKIPEYTIIDDFFVECLALYLAEGDTGFNGKTKPRKLRFTNSDTNVIRYFTRWIDTYFSGNNYYINIIHPISRKSIKEELNIPKPNIRIKQTKDKYNKITKYRVCFDSSIIIDLILSIEPKIKEICLQNKNLAASYIRGMMIGEGTAYSGKSRYVRIEMRNEKEIKYLHKLFILLGFDCKPYLRSERHDMWSLYIGAKQLVKYYALIGFGVHETRQLTLIKAISGINKFDSIEETDPNKRKMLIKRWAKYVREHPIKEWSQKQKEFIDSLIN